MLQSYYTNVIACIVMSTIIVYMCANINDTTFSNCFLAC